MGVLLDGGGRRFQTLGYHDAIRTDGPALELAEIVDGEVGPPLMTVLFTTDTEGGDAEVLVADGSLPLPILAAFMEEVVQEERRIRAPGSPWASGDEDR
jgi:hypothetical protein